MLGCDAGPLAVLSVQLGLRDNGCVPIRVEFGGEIVEMDWHVGGRTLDQKNASDIVVGWAKAGDGAHWVSVGWPSSTEIRGLLKYLPA